jgi:hypothetical protein
MRVSHFVLVSLRHISNVETICKKVIVFELRAPIWTWTLYIQSLIVPFAWQQNRSGSVESCVRGFDKPKKVVKYKRNGQIRLSTGGSVSAEVGLFGLPNFRGVGNGLEVIRLQGRKGGDDSVGSCSCCVSLSGNITAKMYFREYSPLEIYLEMMITL